MNPGYVLERLVLGLTGVCVDVQRIEVTELLDASTMPDPDFVFTVMGMGSDPDRLDLRAGPLVGLAHRVGPSPRCGGACRWLRACRR